MYPSRVARRMYRPGGTDRWKRPRTSVRAVVTSLPIATTPAPDIPSPSSSVTTPAIEDAAAANAWRVSGSGISSWTWAGASPGHAVEQRSAASTGRQRINPLDDNASGRYPTSGFSRRGALQADHRPGAWGPGRRLQLAPSVPVIVTGRPPSRQPSGAPRAPRRPRDIMPVFRGDPRV